MPFKIHNFFFPEKKSVPTLPKISRPVTRNTFIFLFGRRLKVLVDGSLVLEH